MDPNDNPFLQIGEGENPFLQQPAAQPQPVSLYEQFRETGRRNFDVDINDLSEFDEDALRSVYDSHINSLTATMSPFERQVTERTFKSRVPSPADLIRLRDVEARRNQGNATTLDELAAQSDRDRAINTANQRINAASSDTNFLTEDLPAVVGAAAAGVGQGAGATLDTIEDNPLLNVVNDLNPLTAASNYIESLVTGRPFKSPRRMRLEREQSFQEQGITTAGQALNRQSKRLGDFAKSKAGKEYERQLKEVFENHGAAAAAEVALKHPLTGLSSYGPQSLGFIVGSGGGLVGGGRAAVTGADDAARTLSGARKYLQTVKNQAPVAAVVGNAVGTQTGFEVEEFFDKRTDQELVRLPAYAKYEAELLAAGKDASVNSVRQAMRSSASRTARTIGTASSGLIMTFVPGATAIENAVLRKFSLQAGQATAAATIREGAKEAGRAAGVAAVARQVASTAAREGVTEAAEEGIQAGTQSILTQGDRDRAVRDAQFGGLIGGLLGVGLGGGVALTQAGTNNTDEDTDPELEVPTEETVEEESDIAIPEPGNPITQAAEELQTLQEEYSDVFQVFDQQERDRIESTMGVRLDQTTVLGPSLRHKQWALSVLSESEQITGQVYPLLTSGSDAIVIDEASQVIHTTPDGEITPVTPNLQGSRVEQLAYVATAGVHSDILNSQEALAAENDTVTQINRRVADLIEGNLSQTLQQTVVQDPATPNAENTLVSADGDNTIVTYRDLPLATLPQTPPDLASLPPTDRISASYSLGGDVGRSAQRDLIAAREAVTGSVARTAALLEQAGIAPPGSAADIVAEFARGDGTISYNTVQEAGDIPQSALGTVRRIIVQEYMRDFHQDNTLVESNINAIEAGNRVDFGTEEAVTAQADTLADIANETGSAPSLPNAVRPRNARETVQRAPVRNLTPAGFARQENVVPPVPIAPTEVSQATKDIVDEFNAQWPYEQKAQLFTDRTQYEAARANGAVGDVIPVFMTHLRNDNPTANIAYGVLERFSVPELLGETGETTLMTSLKSAVGNKTTNLHKIAKEVRRDYGDTLTNDEVTMEAFGRALEGGFKGGEVGEAVSFIRNTLINHGSGEVFKTISEEQMRGIIASTNTIYRAPLKRNEAGEVVPDPGGLSASPDAHGSEQRLRREQQKLVENPANGWLGERRRDVSARRFFGSVYNLRNQRELVRQTLGQDLFGPIYNTFVLNSNRAAAIAERDKAELLGPYDKMVTVARNLTGLKKPAFFNQYDQVIKAINTIERNQWFQLQQGRLNDETVSMAFPALDIAENSNAKAEDIRAKAMNDAQQGIIDGPTLRSILETLWAEHGKPDRDSQFYFDNNEAQMVIDKAASQVHGDKTALNIYRSLYLQGLRPIIDRINEHRQEAGVNGVGFNNIIDAMGFQFYVPLTDGKDTNENAPMLSFLAFNPSNRKRHTAEGRKNDSQHIHTAVIEQLDMAHHEIVDGQMLNQLADFAKQEFAIDRGNGVVQRTTGGDMLGIEFVTDPVDPVFKAGRSKGKEYVRPGWQAPRGSKGSKRNEFTIRNNGQSQVMRLNNSGLTEAMLARWPKAIGGALGEAEVATRTLAQSFTTRKPTFWLKQFLRDVQETPVIIGTEVGAKEGAQTLANIGKLMTPARVAAQYKYFRANASERAAMRENFSSDPLMKHFNSYVDEGGLSLFTQQLELEGRDQLGDIQGTDGPRLGRTLGGLADRTALSEVFSRMDAFTNTIENMHRFGAYAALVENGMSTQEAAVKALEIINFGQNSLQVNPDDVTVGLGNALGLDNQTGRDGRRTLKALFAFSRSGTTGADRFWNRAIWKGGQRPTQFIEQADGTFTPALQADWMRNLNYPMIGFRIAQGAAVTALVGSIAAKVKDDLDDEETATLGKVIDTSQWMGNMIIPTGLDGESHIALPQQIGAGKFFYGLGALGAQVANGNVTYEKALDLLANSLAENTTPSPRYSRNENVSTAMLKTISPTLMRPSISLALNSSDFGGPIFAEKRNSAYDGSAYTRAFQSTPDFYTDVSRQMNELGVDVAPESIRFMFRSFSGDVGNITDRMLRDLSRRQDGLDRNSMTDGLLGAFVPNVNSSRWVPESQFWEEHERAMRYVEVYNNRLKDDKDGVTRGASKQVETQYPKIKTLRTVVRRAGEDRTKLNKVRRSIRQDSSLSTAQRQERLRKVDSQYRELYLRYAQQMRTITSNY